MRNTGRTVRHPVRWAGVTLVELIVVIALLGILAAGTTAFLRYIVGGYVDTARRDQLASTARIGIERMSRELRNALPNSVRVSGDGRCVEFMPRASSGIYQDRQVSYGGGVDSRPLPIDGHTAATASVFDAFDLAFTPQPGTEYRVVVYPLDAAEAYAAPKGGTGTLLPYQGASTAANASRIDLGADYAVPRHSPQRRFHIAAEPVSFCADGGELRRYSGYGFNAVQPIPGAFGTDGRLMAEYIRLSDNSAPVEVFTIAPQTLSRNAIVKIDLRVEDGGEWVRLDHEVQLRNVP